MPAYEEIQIFQKKWLIGLLSALSLIPLVIVGSQTGINWAILLGIAILLLSMGLLFSMKQQIRIDAEGVHYKQTPFHLKFQTLPWSTIQAWNIYKINALGDFGGWGIRYTGKKKGYIMEGKYGLELKTNAKTLTVLSIKNEEATAQAMEAFGKYV